MDMAGFWSQVVSRITPAQLRAQNEAAFLQAQEEWGGRAEYAVDVIPCCGPGGLVSDADELEYGDGSDTDDDDDYVQSNPSVTGETSLMAYRSDVDELYMWKDDDGRPRWLLWNY